MGKWTQSIASPGWEKTPRIAVRHTTYHRTRFGFLSVSRQFSARTFHIAVVRTLALYPARRPRRGRAPRRITPGDHEGQHGGTYHKDRFHIANLSCQPRKRRYA